MTNITRYIPPSGCVPERTVRVPEGTVVEYQLWDEQLRPCVRGLDREQARELKRMAGGYVVKVEVVH